MKKAADYVWQALDMLKVNRIDHGVRSEEDPELMQRLIRDKMPLTVCPLSNLKLCVVDDMREHNIRRLLQQGVKVTVNSDDPSYFGGYMNDNFIAITQALDLTADELKQLVSTHLKPLLFQIQKNKCGLLKFKHYNQQGSLGCLFL